MRRAIMTIDTVHSPWCHTLELVRSQRPVSIRIFSDAALHILNPNPGDYLSMVVGRNVGDLVRNVHVPVNPCDQAGGGTPAADINQHAYLPGRILLVIRVVIENFQLSAEKLFRPVTLLTGFRRRP